jgi:Ice-binding-like/Bacterial Ig-like domain
MYTPSLLPRTLRAAACLSVAGLLAACGGGRDPILGSPEIGARPTVTSTTPATATPVLTAVDTRTRVQATFSKPMQSLSITATSFTLACPAATAVAATVAYDMATRVATLTPAQPLPPSTTCVATVTAAVQDTTGLDMAAPYTWSFTTGIALAPDTTRPTVLGTTPATGEINVALNQRPSVVFSEPMSAATLNGTSFTLRDTVSNAAVAGSVGYSADSRALIFTPTAALTAATNYTATLSTAATDLAGNALAGNTAVVPGAGNHVWAFTTGAAPDATPPTVIAFTPANGSTGQCLGRSASATLGEAMDATSFNTTSFAVTDNGVAVPGAVIYDASTRVASFLPADAAGFAANRTIVVTLLAGATGVKDLAGNALAAAVSWSFGTGTQACLAAVNLGAAASFGAFGGAAGVTNQGINTVIGGDIGTTAACTLVTGLHDARNVYTETPLNVGGVNGSVNCAPPAPGTAATLAIATQARADAQTAYDTLAALPAGSDPGAGQLGGLTLASGVYTAAGGSFGITSGDLVLDAQGDPGAVWVFQSASALTVGLPATPRRVLLINGARARNVYWQVGSAARIEDGSQMVGTVIAPAGVTLSTPGQTTQTVLTGRAIGLTASVTMVNTTIVAP